MKQPKYSIPEIERRWLVIQEKLPNLAELEKWEVTDHYLVGSRLRLRKMVSPNKTSVTKYKLCKKYGKVSKIKEPITNIYLTEDEYNKFSGMEANVIKKIKYQYEFRGIMFSLNVFTDLNMIIAEAEFESENQAFECQLPEFIGEEVSSLVEYEGATIAK